MSLVPEIILQLRFMSLAFTRPSNGVRCFLVITTITDRQCIYVSILHMRTQWRFGRSIFQVLEVSEQFYDLLEQGGDR